MMTNTSDNVTFNEVAQEEPKALTSISNNDNNDNHNHDDNYGDIESTPLEERNDEYIPSINNNNNNTINYSNRSGRTRNTILGPIYKRSFQLVFITTALILIIIGTSIKSPSKFIWPPPPVNYDPNNHDDFISTLNTDWKPMTIFTPKFKSDHTYYQNTIMKTETSVHTYGLGKVDSVTELDIDARMSIIDNDLQNTETVEYRVTHLHLIQEVNGDRLVEWDSEDDLDVWDDLELKFLRDVVGHTSEITINKEGQILQSKEHEGLQNAIEKDKISNNLSASQQYRSISRFTELLPQPYTSTTTADDVGSANKQKGRRYGIQPGDTWDFETYVEGNDSVEYYTNQVFIGVGTLLGYTKYDGVDVAVISLNATIENFEISLDIDDLGIFDDFSSWKDDMSDTTIKSGQMESVLYWDFVHHYPRWYKGDMNLVISMPNPMSIHDPDNTMMDVPTHEEFEIYMKMR